MASDEPAGGPKDVSDSEAEFSMDPQVVIWELARALVRGQRELASIRRTADKVRQAGAGAPPEAAEYLAAAKDFEQSWYAETLPMITASMQLAQEVYETFGPGMTRVVDPTEAALWNNKHHVWFKELSGSDVLRS